MGRFRSPLRWLAISASAYLALVLVANGMIFAGVLLARALGHGPEVDDGLPSIRNLRKVDARVYASGQPESPHYKALAERGFSLVVDLRAHTPSDPGRDDEDHLRSLGLDYLHVPVVDGRAPDERSVQRVLSAIEETDGKVILHCGGGVGRSTSVSAAYLATKGRDITVFDQLAVGPPTLEQIYFVAATGRENAYAENDVVNFFSRYVVDAPRRLWHVLTGI